MAKRKNGLSDFRQAVMEQLLFLYEGGGYCTEEFVSAQLVDVIFDQPPSVQGMIIGVSEKGRETKVRTALKALAKLKFVNHEDDGTWSVLDGVAEIVTCVEPEIVVSKNEKTDWQKGLSDKVIAEAVTWSIGFVERIREHSTLGRGSGAYVDKYDDFELAEYLLTMWCSGGTDIDKSGYNETKLWSDIHNEQKRIVAESDSEALHT